MLQQYGRVPQLGWNLYALSPQASFDYVLFPVLQSANLNLLLWGEQEEEGKK